MDNYGGYGLGDSLRGGRLSRESYSPGMLPSGYEPPARQDSAPPLRYGAGSHTESFGPGVGGQVRRGYEYAPPPSRSILDILASGGRASDLPGTSVGPQVLEGPQLPLPKADESPLPRLEDWVGNSLTGYVSAGQAQLRKAKDPNDKDLLLSGARNSFSIARMIDPNSPEPRIGLIQVDLLAGNYHKATQMIRDLGRRAPQIFSSQFDVRLWHELPETYDDFLRQFRLQVTGTTEMPSVLNGYVAWTTNDRQAASNHFKQAAQIAPQEQAWVGIIRALESPATAKLPSPTMGTILGR
jgi:hypothetical protein